MRRCFARRTIPTFVTLSQAHLAIYGIIPAVTINLQQTLGLRPVDDPTVSQELSSLPTLPTHVCQPQPSLCLLRCVHALRPDCNSPPRLSPLNGGPSWFRGSFFRHSLTATLQVQLLCIYQVLCIYGSRGHVTTPRLPLRDTHSLGNSYG